MQFSYVALGISSASHSMAVLKEETGSISARGQGLIDNFGGILEGIRSMAYKILILPGDGIGPEVMK